MEDEADSGRQVGFLPPEPTGPEPDLGASPQPPRAPEPAQPAQPAQPAPSYSPPRQEPGRSQGSPGGPHPGQPQAGLPQPHQQPNQPWSYPPDAGAPDNGAAVAGLTLSITAGALLVLSVTTSTIISVVCAALGIYYSRKGRDRVDRGETPKHRGVAQAGFVTGIVTLGLSIFFTILWLLFLVLFATNEEFREDLKDELEDSGSPGGFETSLRVGAITVRVVASLLG